MNAPNLIMVIDDNVDDYYIIKRLLKNDYETVFDACGANIIELVNTYQPACILLDYHLGLKDGADVLASIKENETLAELPVIFLTNETDPDTIVKCMKSKAADYLVKDRIERSCLLKTIDLALKEVALNRTIKEQQAEILRLSRFDELTGTYNKRFFFEKITQEINMYRRGKMFFSLGIIDIDFFKAINDTYGHMIGDDLLREAGDVLKKNIRETDYLGRFGGDEFIVMMCDYVDKPFNEHIDNHRNKFDKIRKNFEAHMKVFLTEIIHKSEKVSKKIEDDIQKLTISIGFTVIEDLSETQDILVNQADKALYKVKNSDRNGLAYYYDNKIYLVPKEEDCNGY